MLRFIVSRRVLSPFSQFPSTVFNCFSSSIDPYKSIKSENEPCTPTVCSNSAPPAPSPSPSPSNLPQKIEIPSLVPSSKVHLDYGFMIELVDHYLWPSQMLSGTAKTVEVSKSLKEHEVFDEMPDKISEVQEFPDFDEIEDLRIRKKLFFKLDKGSKEFEEYSVNFYQKKSLKKARERENKAETKKKECKKLEKETKAEMKAKKESRRIESVVKQHKGKASLQSRGESPNNESTMEPTIEPKRVRTQTFNQLTGPYHLPFCLDIFITKGSVRASIIHRVTSKVVAVAHSISKDLKFDIGSRKDTKACAAVGGVLAQRAIEDDIHNVVYTPRKGDIIEGKLQVVLQSIIDNGINVKVKLKQKKPVKRTNAMHHPPVL